MVDECRIAFNPAVEISYLTEEHQKMLKDEMDACQATPSLTQSRTLKQMSQTGTLTREYRHHLLTEEKPNQRQKFFLNQEDVQRYFPKHYTPQQMQQVIIHLLHTWQHKRGYYAAVTAMDRGVGRLLDRLEEKGLVDNTLVIFAADNGMNVKVPFLVRWPSVMPAGQVSQRMVSAYDFFPTLLDLLELDAQQIQHLPGTSFADTLRGQEVCGRQEVVIFDEYGPVRMIRSRRYKYIHRYPYGPDKFYDLENDPGEESNRIDDAAFAPQILAMRRRMERWFNRYVDPDVDGSREGVTGSGQLCSAGTYAQQLQKYAPPGKNS